MVCGALSHHLAKGLKKSEYDSIAFVVPFFIGGKSHQGVTHSLMGAAATEETLFQLLLIGESDGCVPWRGLPCISNETISVMGI